MILAVYGNFGSLRSFSLMENAARSFYCAVCQVYITCGKKDCDSSISLSHHERKSQKHKNLVSLQNVILGKRCRAEVAATDGTYWGNSDSLSDTDSDQNEINMGEERDDYNHDNEKDEIMENFTWTEFMNVSKSIRYGRLNESLVEESIIFTLQEEISKPLNAILRGEAPCYFQKVGGKSVDWKTALSITSTFIGMNVSLKKGDTMIALISEAVNEECGRPARLPSTIETLMNNFFKYLKRVSPVQLWKSQILPSYFTSEFCKLVQGKVKKIPRMTAPFIKVEAALAQLLLSIDPVDFDDSVGPVYNIQGERVYSTFGRSQYAQDLQKTINDTLSHTQVKPLLLSIAVWIDKAPLNASMSRSATPLVIMIMNDKKHTTFTLGYVPDKLPLSDEVLSKLMRKYKMTQSKTIIEQILKEAKRQALHDFVSCIFKDFLEHVISEEGIDIQVGIGESKKFYRVMPVVTHFPSDNVQAYDLSGVNSTQCRICNKKDFSDFCIGLDYSNISLRNWKNQVEICSTHSDLEVIRIHNISLGHNMGYLSNIVQEKMRLSSVKRLKIAGIVMHNKLYNLLNHFSSDQSGTVSTGRLFPADILHTVLKGIVEYVLGWSLQMCYIMKYLDPQYCDAIADVVDIIKNFPAHNSLQPFRHTRFSDIASLVKNESQGKTQSSISSNITDILALTETWKLPSALLQLLFAITSGSVFPSNYDWCSKIGMKDKSFNMERCFINAMVSALDIVFLTNAPSLTQTQVDETYPSIVSNAQCHLVVLHHVRTTCINFIKQKSIVKKKKQLIETEEYHEDEGLEEPPISKVESTTFNGSMKIALLEHLPKQVEAFGSSKNSYDTGLYESTNRQQKESFQRTNKRNDTTSLHILDNLQKKFHMKQMSNTLCLLTNTTNEPACMEPKINRHPVYDIVDIDRNTSKMQLIIRKDSKAWSISSPAQWNNKFSCHPLWSQAERLASILDFFPTICSKEINEVKLLTMAHFVVKPTETLLAQGILDFTLYCDPTFVSNKYAQDDSDDNSVSLPRYSIVQYTSADTNVDRVGQIIAIVKVENDIKFVVAVLCLATVARKLPYTVMEYAMQETDRTLFKVEGISSSHILAPIFSVPAIEMLNLKNQRYMNIDHVGRHHMTVNTKSYFYVLQPDRILCRSSLNYDVLMLTNTYCNPWYKKKNSLTHFNFNQYLTIAEMAFIRDYINAKD